jgi:hypothetical protein
VWIDYDVPNTGLKNKLKATFEIEQFLWYCVGHFENGDQ